MRRRAAALLLPALLLAASCAEDRPAAPSEVEGPVVEVRTEGGRVTGLVVESDGERYEILIDPAVDYRFDLAHLHEHREAGDPVRVALEERDGALYALRIDDA